jgi:hypothetical protein
MAPVTTQVRAAAMWMATSRWKVVEPGGSARPPVLGGELEGYLRHDKILDEAVHLV